MKILALEHEVPGTVADQFQQYAKDEARIVWKLHQTGVIREMYFRADQNTAVLLLECDSIVEAKNTISTLPFVKEKLIAFEFIPLKAYSGFERLFEKA